MKTRIKRTQNFSEPPTVEAIPRTDAPGWQFRCPHCAIWHLHGVTLGHRDAHCIKPGTPYTHGYVLSEVKKRSNRSDAVELLNKTKK